MLSREELQRFNEESVDPGPLGRVVNEYDNVGLTDEELRSAIISRNELKKPTYKLRMEYHRRLHQRGL